jgi:hypothetical protein
LIPSCLGARACSTPTATFAINAAAEGAAAIGYHALGAWAWRDAAGAWMYCVPDAVLSSCLFGAERCALHTLLAYGLLKIASQVSPIP